MLDMQAWQYVVTAVVAVISIGWMSFATVRLFTRRASAKANVREATAVESGLAGATIPEGTRVFDAWSYRVGARFAGRIRIAVSDERVAVAGPRIPRLLYQMWIWVQGLLLALVPPVIVAGAVMLDWRWIVSAVAIFVVSFGVSMGGAGLWPGLGELFVTKEGHFFALEFPRESVNQVDVGKGWSKGGLEVVLFPYKAGIDKMAGQRAVSFFAPDEHGREVRFAMELFTEADVRELSGMLGGTVTGESA
jgi:hypothetical protein